MNLNSDNYNVDFGSKPHYNYHFVYVAVLLMLFSELLIAVQRKLYQNYYSKLVEVVIISLYWSIPNVHVKIFRARWSILYARTYTYRLLLTQSNHLWFGYLLLLLRLLYLFMCYTKSICIDVWSIVVVIINLSIVWFDHDAKLKQKISVQIQRQRKKNRAQQRTGKHNNVVKKTAAFFFSFEII